MYCQITECYNKSVLTLSTSVLSFTNGGIISEQNDKLGSTALNCLSRMDVPVGKTVYTCMLNKRAGVEADLTVSVRGTEQVQNPNFWSCAMQPFKQVSLIQAHPHTFPSYISYLWTKF